MSKTQIHGFREIILSAPTLTIDCEDVAWKWKDVHQRRIEQHKKAILKLQRENKELQKKVKDLEIVQDRVAMIECWMEHFGSNEKKMETKQKEETIFIEEHPKPTCQ